MNANTLALRPVQKYSTRALGGNVSPGRFQDATASLVTNGFAIMKLHAKTLKPIWSSINGIHSVSNSTKQDFCFPECTDGFFPKGGERAKYTNNIDLCDRFCYWHKNRAAHTGRDFAGTPLYRDIVSSEEQLSHLARELIDGIWGFFLSTEKMRVRESSYVQLCVYDNDYHVADREYLQDKHEDGHLITLIKPNRDGLVVFQDDVEVPVHLADDEIIAITRSPLTMLSDGQIAPIYHAVRNPMMALSRRSLVYFAIPDLTRGYTSLLAKKQLDIAPHADESHRAFGNAPLV